jgi:hypothetical protein
MTAPSRPKRVVIVDADNPLVEVRGEFFWREDHDAVVAAARDAAYRSGYRAGWNDGVSQTLTKTVTLHQTPSTRERIWGLIARLLLFTGLMIIAITIVQVLLSQT